MHFLKIWIEHDVVGIEPGYEQKRFEPEEKRGKLRLIASSDARDGSVTLHQDAALYAALLDGAERAEHALAPGRRARVHLARGALTVNGRRLAAGDALKAPDVDSIVLDAGRHGRGPDVRSGVTPGNFMTQAR